MLSAELGAMNGEEEMDETAELWHELKYGITFPTIQTDSAVLGLWVSSIITTLFYQISKENCSENMVW